jgi:hypothetical protein
MVAASAEYRREQRHVERLRKAVSTEMAPRSWEIENKLRADASALFLQDTPFVIQ